jgi:O-antigen ligase
LIRGFGLTGRDRFFDVIIIAGLYTLIFSLPLMETVKHAGFYLLLAGFLCKSIMEKPAGWRKPDMMECSLLAMGAVSFLSTVSNWPLPEGFGGFRDTFCFLSLFWIMYRGRWDSESLKGILLLIPLSLIAGLAWGYLEWQKGITTYFEFHSVGIVTRSSLYLGMGIFVLAGVVLDNTGKIPRWIRILSIASLGLTVPCLFLMGSRGSVYAVLLTGIFVAPFCRKHPLFKVCFLYCAIVIFAFAMITVFSKDRNSQAVDRIRHLTANFSRNGFVLDTAKGPNDQIRFERWRVGLSQALKGDSPFLGVGPLNFSSINIDKFTFNPPLETFPPNKRRANHAHNLFITKWAEEGFLGLGAFLLFLGCIVFRLRRFAPEDHQIKWTFVAGVGAIVIPLASGLFNSSFTKETAWFSMLILGLFFNQNQK